MLESRRTFIKMALLAGDGLALPNHVRVTEPQQNKATDHFLDTQIQDPFESLMQPFTEETSRRRIEYSRSDPDYNHRIEAVLNRDRVNFLLFGYGETHEPPITEKATIGSTTILSYKKTTHSIDLISFTHDIRAPEIEHHQGRKDKYNGQAIKIDKAYEVGGFELMRQVMENATGLSLDFQIAFKDRMIKDSVDRLFENIEIDVPRAFEVYPFYLDGQKYPGDRFDKGRQRINGLRAIQFIKTVPVKDDSKELEHNRRKHLVFEAIFAGLKNNAGNPLFWPRALTFLNDELNNGTIACDFDPKTLLINNIGGIASGIGNFIIKGGLDPAKVPQINRTLYVVDISSGDGGVRWVNSDVNVNPVTKKDWEAGVYQDKAMEIPSDANPYAEDLVSHYWPSVRSLVRRFLLATET